jgi:NAD(P)-dependent dehydrogenase (short-subunit alcohol dehydrogenase family)
MVTGAASGMGQAIALLLAGSGAPVTLVDRNAEGLEAVASLINRGGGRAIAVPGSVDRHEDLGRAVTRTVAEFGSLRLAANVAGIASDAAKVGDMTPEAWDEVIAINLSAQFYGMHYQIPAMLAAGGGAIVNVSSVFGDRGQDSRPGYAASKHGIRGLTKSVVVDYAASGIRCNELQPGVIRTPMIQIDLPRAEAFAAHIPQQRLGTPDEIAAAVAFLLSDDASYINGAHLTVDGGFLC